MKGRNVQLPAVHVNSQRGVRGARGAVFRDIVLGFVTAARRPYFWKERGARSAHAWIRIPLVLPIINSLRSFQGMPYLPLKFLNALRPC